MKFLTFALVLALAHPLQAETFAEGAMKPGLFTDLSQALTYTHERKIPEAKEPPAGYRLVAPVSAEVIHLRPDPVNGLVLTAELDGATRPLTAFPKGAPNPILLVFLENVMRSTAQVTGGSHDYIRNRMRTSIGTQTIQDLPEARQGISYQPFLEDRYAERLGEFAGLTISISWSKGDPSRLVELKAEAGETYRETLILSVKE